MSWPTKPELRRKVQVWLAMGKANGARAVRYHGAPEDLALSHLDRLRVASITAPFVCIHERSTSLIYRIFLGPGNEGEFTVEIMHQLMAKHGSEASAIVLFDEPLNGPFEGKVHFGVLLGCDLDDDEKALAVYDASE